MGSVEEEWKQFREAVNESAIEVCGMRRIGGKRNIGREWWNDEVSVVVAEKKRAFEVWLQTKDAVTYDRYRMKRSEVKRMVNVARKDANLRWGRRMEENF